MKVATCAHCGLPIPVCNEIFALRRALQLWNSERPDSAREWVDDANAFRRDYEEQRALPDFFLPIAIDHHVSTGDELRVALNNLEFDLSLVRQHGDEHQEQS